MRIDPVQAVNLLKASNIQIIDLDESILEIAKKNNTTPKKLYSIFFRLSSK